MKLFDENYIEINETSLSPRNIIDLNKKTNQLIKPKTIMVNGKTFTTTTKTYDEIKPIRNRFKTNEINLTTQAQQKLIELNEINLLNTPNDELKEKTKKIMGSIIYYYIPKARVGIIGTKQEKANLQKHYSYVVGQKKKKNTIIKPTIQSFIEFKTKVDEQIKNGINNDLIQDTTTRDYYNHQSNHQDHIHEEIQDLRTHINNHQIRTTTTTQNETITYNTYEPPLEAFSYERPYEMDINYLTREIRNQHENPISINITQELGEQLQTNISIDTTNPITDDNIDQTMQQLIDLIPTHQQRETIQNLLIEIQHTTNQQRDLNQSFTDRIELSNRIRQQITNLSNTTNHAIN